MLNKCLYGFTVVFTGVLILFLHGKILIPNVPLPPLGKFLDPFHGSWSSNTNNEKSNISLTTSGLKGKVNIIYDERRVPHIYADNLEDALFAQGYVAAQNRLFQMHFLTLAAAGELSSIFGDKTIEIDKEKRRRGMKYAAEKAVAGWEKQKTYNHITSYADGANAFINSLSPDNYPFEFKLFNIEPSQWTPLKSALVFKQMTLTLAGRNDDIESTNLISQLGQDEFNFLYPEHEAIENPVIPAENPYAFDTIYGDKVVHDDFVKKPLLNQYYENRNKGIGSNNWAVSGAKTSTGKPILCNDPHLSLGLPSIWFELHIHTPEINAHGVSFPGFPGIMIGFNENIAWGETNVGQDVEDLLLIKWANTEKTKYVVDDKEKEIILRLEEVKVKGKPSVIDTIKYTDWGPIYQTSDDGQHDLAMRWLAHDEPNMAEFDVFIDAMSCKNYDDYLKATSQYICPAQNFAFASKSGDIALRVNGIFPAKTSQDGRFVKFGDKSNNNWQSYIPRYQNPQIINPKRGFIASSNQVSADKTYPYYFTGKFERYRNRSVNNKLSVMENITPEDMKKMQQDAFSYKAADFLEVVKNMQLDGRLSNTEKEILEKLLQWDKKYIADAIAPTYFEIFYKKLSENTWDEILGIRKTMDVKLPEDIRLAQLLKSDPTNKYFDIKSTPEKETAVDIVIKSIKDMNVEVEQRSKDGKGIKWNQFKPLNIYHLTRLPALSEMDVSTDGCVDAINAVGVSYGPSWRMIVSLEENIHAYCVYPGGQSGNPCSKFYKNMIRTWAAGQYYKVEISRTKEDIIKNQTQTVQLN